MNDKFLTLPEWGLIYELKIVNLSIWLKKLKVILNFFLLK